MLSKYKFWIQDRIAVRANGPIQEIFKSPVDDGISVINEDWDNLFILDGCRADLFEESIDLEIFDEYSIKKSMGSCTPQWISRNFSDGSFGDTVYISANAFISKMVPDRFHRTIQIKETDENFGVVHPESVRDAVAKAAEQFPEKRFIVHFVQPHMPFLPTPGLVYRDKYKNTSDSEKGYNPLHVHDALATGAVSFSEWWEGYRENLDLVFNYAMECAELLEGKSVFSSDHGNMAGERGWPVPVRHYGHPRNLRSPELVNVPWGVLTIGGRRQWTDDGVHGEQSIDSDKIDARLTALGYKT